MSTQAPPNLQLHALYTVTGRRMEVCFARFLALSLLVHLVAGGVLFGLTENARCIPHKNSVIDVDLFRIETSGRQKALSSPTPRPEHRATPASTRRTLSKQAAHFFPQRVAEKHSGLPAGEIMADKAARVNVHKSDDEPSPSVGEPATLTASVKGTVTAEYARGNGGSPGTGDGQKGKKVLQDYSNTIRALIDAHKEYPRAARRMGIRGSVAVSFSLDRHGELLKVSLAKSSGCTLLDNAGLRAVRSVGRFPPPPREGMTGEEISFSLPMTFTLTSG